MYTIIDEIINSPLNTEVKFSLSEEEFKSRYTPILHFPILNFYLLAIGKYLIIEPIKRVLGFDVQSTILKEYLNSSSPLSRGAKLYVKDYGFEHINEYQTHSLNLASFNCKTNAASLAKIAALLGNKGQLNGLQILKSETIDKMNELLLPQYDIVLKQYGHIKSYGGFGYGNSTNTNIRGNSNYMGWGGMGGATFAFNSEKNFGLVLV